MKLQELIGHANLDMSVAHIKAFFLGVLSAERPLPFVKAVEEMMAETPEAIKELEPELKKLWDELVKNKPAELQKLFPESSDLKEFLSNAKDQLDFYLTALSLSGTNTETCKNEDVAELIDELEDTVMDLDEYLSESNADEVEGEELKELLVEAWQDYLRTASI
jgi:hypothetical protein